MPVSLEPPTESESGPRTRSAGLQFLDLRTDQPPPSPLKDRRSPRRDGPPLSNHQENPPPRADRRFRPRHRRRHRSPLKDHRRMLADQCRSGSCLTKIQETPSPRKDRRLRPRDHRRRHLTSNNSYVEIITTHASLGLLSFTIVRSFMMLTLQRMRMCTVEMSFDFRSIITTFVA
jgi:hypothetical protein